MIKHAGAVDTGRVELHELEILERQPGARDHRVAVAGAGVRRRAGEVGAAVAARREDDHLRAEAVQPPGREVDRDEALALAVLHDQIDGEVLDEELRRMLQRLLIQRVQHRVTGAIRRGAGALRRALPEARGHAAERPLVDTPVLRAREWNAVVLELDHRGRGFLAHVLDRVLVAEPVGALDRVVHVPAPIVLAHVAECSTDAALRGHRVAAGREHLRHAGRREPLLGEAERRAQAGAACADDDHVVVVIDELVFFGHY